MKLHKAIIVSFIMHAIFVSSISIMLLGHRAAFVTSKAPGTGNSVSVYPIGTTVGSGHKNSDRRFSDRSSTINAGGNESSEGASSDDTSAGEIVRGSGKAGSGDPILAKILRRVNKSKYYPTAAKKNGLEGVPRVTFAIEEDGSVTSLIISSSCGERVLDDSALETIRRAAPLPYYPKAITLAIKYSLRE